MVRGVFWVVAVGVVGGSGGLVGGIDGNRHCRHITGGSPVICPVGKAVGAGIACGRGIGEGSVGIQRQGPVGGVAHQLCSQGLTLRIGIVAKYTGGCYGERGILGGGCRCRWRQWGSCWRH